uniref:ATP synthase subunit f, mitochondrial n=1 Tax=Oryzias sinensis TaxID=183150 RepID=A0A8C7XA38_9TELE
LVRDFGLWSHNSTGWGWYYSRYIDVKKGGVAGVGMLLVGYCVLSYIWSYPHIKYYLCNVYTVG